MVCGGLHVDVHQVVCKEITLNPYQSSLIIKKVLAFLIFYKCHPLRVKWLTIYCILKYGM